MNEMVTETARNADGEVMVDSRMVIRDACVGDAPFITECILSGIGLHDFEDEYSPMQRMQYDSIRPECSMDESLYSYRFARIAEVDGVVAGALVSYRGELYAGLRDRTWERIDALLDEACPVSDYETGPGEYYLDTLAVHPRFRGMGLGSMLIEDAVICARRQGCSRATLIVEKDHPRLVAYYRRLGFVPESELSFLGEDYYKCVQNLTIFAA